MLQIWSIALFVIFLIALAALAVWAGKQNKKGTGDGAVEYYLGGRTTPIAVLAMSLATSAVSASCFIGDPALMSTIGWPYGWIIIANNSMMVVAALIMMKRMRRQAEALGSLTIPEYLGHRYNSPVLRVIVALAIVLCYLFMMVGQFKGAAVLLEQFTGVNFNVGLIIITAVTVFYVVSGGLRSVAWTDFAQGAPIFILCIVVFFLALIKAGGFNAVDTWLAENDPQMLNIIQPSGEGVLVDLPGIISTFVFFLIIFLSQPYMSSRFLAIPNPTKKSIGKFMLIVALIMFVFNAFIWIGLFGHVLFPDVDPDYLSTEVVKQLLPAPIAALMMIGFFGAILTTATSVLLTMGQSIGRDLYALTINKKATLKQEILVTQVGVVVIGILCCVFNWIDTPPLLAIFTYLGLSGVGCCIGTPLFSGIMTKRATKEGAIASSLVGPAVFLVIQNGLGQTYMIACCIGTIAAVVTMIVASAIFGKTPHNLELQKRYDA